jgi:hypothetical protein
MLVDAEIQAQDGIWHKARLWVDSGNPEFCMHETMAEKLGSDVAEDLNQAASGAVEVSPPIAVRIAGMLLDFTGVQTKVMRHPGWLFSTMNNDANLPATVLRKYQVVFDYPKQQLTLAEAGALQPRGARAAASIHPATGIVQIDAVIDGDSLSFALDNGASYSFASGDLIARLARQNPRWPRMTGTLGCANMWGWWPPAEETLPVLRIAQIQWGPARLAEVGVVGVSRISPHGPSLGDWYSHKTARPVSGFLGVNAFRAYRVEIDYANGAVYFEKGEPPDFREMEMVGLTLRQEVDGSYRIIGVAERDGMPSVAEVLPGDTLLGVDGQETTGATMGTVVDALRGRPGETRDLLIAREGRRFQVAAVVRRFL